MLASSEKANISKVHGVHTKYKRFLFLQQEKTVKCSLRKEKCRSTEKKQSDALILNWYPESQLHSIPARSKFPFHSLKSVMNKVFNIKPWSWAQYWISFETWLTFGLSRNFPEEEACSECTLHSALLFSAPGPPRSFLSWNTEPQLKLKPYKPAAECIKKPHSIITGFITSQVSKMLQSFPQYRKHWEISLGRQN